MKHLAIAEIELRDPRDEVKVRDILERLAGNGMFVRFTWNVVDVEEDDIVLKPVTHGRNTALVRIYYNGVAVGFAIPRNGGFFAVVEIVKRDPEAPITEDHPTVIEAARDLVERLRAKGVIV